jgi:hypothetical protein
MSLEELRTIFSGFTLVSLIFVALNYWFSISKAKKDAIESRDKGICEQAIISLERAYGSLTNKKADYSLPTPDRLNWLTSARQIIRFQELKAMLETDLYKLICAEHEEHWKHEFYLSLKVEGFILPDYFKSNNIHLKSALVIMNFKQWASNVEDPLDTIDGTMYTDDDYTLKGEHGLDMCIQESDEKYYK